MPSAEVTRSVVTHYWDDESSTDYHISSCSENILGPYVCLKEGNDAIHFRKESWPEIKQQIDGFFAVMEE